MGIFKCWELHEDEELELFEDDIKEEAFLIKESLKLKCLRKRWLVLTSQYLCSFRRKGNYRKPTEFIRLCDLISVRAADDESGKANSFCVSTRERTFLLIAGTSCDRDMWTAAIMNWCLPELACRATKRSLAMFEILEEEDDQFDPLTPRNRVRRISTFKIMPQAAAETTKVLGKVLTRELDGEESCKRSTQGVSKEESFDLPGPVRRLSSRRPSAVMGAVVSEPIETTASGRLLDVVSGEILLTEQALRHLRRRSSRNLSTKSLPLGRSGSLSLDAVVQHIDSAESFQEQVSVWRKENEESLQVGDDVKAWDAHRQTWVHGQVTCVGPVKVKPKGSSKGQMFETVRRVESRRRITIT